MAEVSSIFLCSPHAKGRLLKAPCNLQKCPKWYQVSWSHLIRVQGPGSEFHLQRSPFMILKCLPIWNTMTGKEGSPWCLPPQGENFILAGPEHQPACLSFRFLKARQVAFYSWAFGRDRISQGEHLHSAQYREVVNCLYGPTSPGRARRHLCVKTLHPGRGKKNTKKIKREKYRIKWKFPPHLMDL